MITDYYKKRLIIGIVIVSLLLLCCIAVDYADEIRSDDVPVTVPKDTVVVNDSDVVVDSKLSVIHCKSKVYTVKRKYPIVSMWARPSVRCNLPYKWYYRSFVDYCPHCKRYNVLYDAHKPQAKWEHEWTCARCGADYDAVIGKEKYSWSHYYLRRA